MVIWMSAAWAQPLTLGPDGLPPERPEPPPVSIQEPSLDAEIVGGQWAAEGQFPDVAGLVFYDAYVGCTGTLIAPNVVLTAAHCLTDNAVTQVLLGSTDWNRLGGESIPVENTWIHPTYAEGGRDIGVIKLSRDSTYTPRGIARGCILDEVVDGTPVQIAGFGNINVEGGESTTQLNFASTLVRDADCSEDVLDGMVTGCIDSIRPDGEISAGGRLDVDGDGYRDGPIDSCFGDSGGPLYVDTRYGLFLGGVVSRSFLGVDDNFPCRDGGIYVRPDSVISFIEGRTGVTLAPPSCNLRPVVSADTLIVEEGRSAKLRLEIEDEDSSSFILEVVSTPELGVASVSGQRLHFKADDGAVGSTSVIIAVTDDGADSPNSLPATTEIEVQIRVVERSCGCQTSSGSFGTGLFLGLLGLVRMRRRSAA